MIRDSLNWSLFKKNLNGFLHHKLRYFKQKICNKTQLMKEKVVLTFKTPLSLNPGGGEKNKKEMRAGGCFPCGK